MSIAVLHAVYEIYGGGERLSLVTARALKDFGYDVEIWTMDDVDRNVLRNFSGVDISDIPIRKIDVKYSLIVRKAMDKIMTLRRLAFYNYIFENYDDILKDYDVVIDTQSDIPTSSDISYIHFPARLWLELYERKNLNGLSYLIYHWILSRLERNLVNKDRMSKVLTNSSWTAAFVRKIYGIYPDVLHPPVQIGYFMDCCTSKEDIVVTVSRYAIEKNLEIIPYIAAKHRDLQFVIIGSLREDCKYIYDKLVKLRDELNLENLELLANVPRDKLREILCRAKLYLHPLYPEHFGLSIVEAMASGAVPIVYRDGGAWHDVVSRLSTELGYTTVEEAAYIISRLKREKELLKKLSFRARKIASKFSQDRYSDRLVRIVRRIYKVKKLEKMISLRHTRI